MSQIASRTVQGRVVSVTHRIEERCVHVVAERTDIAVPPLTAAYLTSFWLAPTNYPIAVGDRIGVEAGEDHADWSPRRHGDEDKRPGGLFRLGLEPIPLGLYAKRGN